MARPRKTNPDKLDPEVLRVRWLARKRRALAELRVASGRKRVWVTGEDGKIREKWI